VLDRSVVGHVSPKLKWNNVRLLHPRRECVKDGVDGRPWSENLRRTVGRGAPRVATRRVDPGGDRGVRTTRLPERNGEGGLRRRRTDRTLFLFENRKALLVASFRVVTRILREDMEIAVRGCEGSPSAPLRAIPRTDFETLAANPKAARVFLIETTGVSAGIDAVLARRPGELGTLCIRSRTAMLRAST
jgi:hypothetical protein